MQDFQHLIIPRRDFTHLTGEVTSYRFGSGVASHDFCPVCGIKAFYTPRSNPDGVSVNYRCVDKSTFGEVAMANFDGQNWEKNAAQLSHLSD